MASSTYGGLVRFDTADMGAGEACHTDIVRAAFNNALHLMDERGQCRVSWTAKDTSSVLATQAPDAADTWYPICAAGPWPASLLADGTPFSLVVAMAGASPNGHAVKFRAVLSPWRDAPAEVTLADGNTMTTSTTTNSSNAWLSDAAGTNLITMTADHARTAFRGWPTLSALSGSSVSVEMCLLWLTVWGSTANVGSTPKLAGLYAREYVGT